MARFCCGGAGVGGRVGCEMWMLLSLCDCCIRFAVIVVFRVAMVVVVEPRYRILFYNFTVYIRAGKSLIGEGIARFLPKNE